MIQCFHHTREKTWDEDLQLLAGAICAMKNRSTGFSANMLMLGSEVSQPVYILFGAALRTDDDVDPADYVKQLRQKLREIHSLATQKMRSQMQYQKWNYDLKLQEYHYEVGDFVFRCNKASKVGSSKKLNPIWVGPLLVTEVINPVLYRVHDRKREYVLHHNLLKRCEVHTIPFWLWKMRHNLMDLDTTIAYNSAEQQTQSQDTDPVAPSLIDGAPSSNVSDSKDTDAVAPSSIDGAQSSSVSDLPDESSSVCLDNSDADSQLAGTDSIALAMESSISVNTNAPEEEQGEDGNGESLPSWMDESRDWGLKSLLSDSPTVHVYAQKGGVSGKGRWKKGYSPADLVFLLSFSEDWLHSLIAAGNASCWASATRHALHARQWPKTRIAPNPCPIFLFLFSLIAKTCAWYVKSLASRVTFRSLVIVLSSEMLQSPSPDHL